MAAGRARAAQDRAAKSTHVEAASESAEAAAAGDRAVPAAAEQPAAAVDDVLEQGEAVQYYDKQHGGVVEVTVQTVHRDDVPAYYTIRLPSGQQRATQRELLWRKGEVRPPIDEAGAPADAAQQVRAVA